MGPSTSRCGSRIRTNPVAVLTFRRRLRCPIRRWSRTASRLGLDAELRRGLRRTDRDVGELFRRWVRDDRAVAVCQHPIGQAHQEDAGHRETSGTVLMISSAGRTVCAVVWAAPDTMPSTMPLYTSMVPKYESIAHDLAGPLDGDSLCLAQLGILRRRTGPHRPAARAGR